MLKANQLAFANESPKKRGKAKNGSKSKGRDGKTQRSDHKYATVQSLDKHSDNTENSRRGADASPGRASNRSKSNKSKKSAGTRLPSGRGDPGKHHLVQPDMIHSFGILPNLQQSQGLSFKRSPPPVQAVEEHNPVQFIDQFDPILDMEHHSQAPLEAD